MKKMKKVFTCIMVLVCLLAITILQANAGQLPLDEIRDYTITVNMRPDGTMDIRYHLEWKVLNDSREGPLEWVKIGIPNKHVDGITALSDNIKDIKYYASDGGHYIRIDFDRAYYEGETVIFDYTIHQSYMYVIEKENNICRYSFTPGWFEEIVVKNITIKWSSMNVIESTSQKIEDGYLIWNSSLGLGERMNASVRYNLDVFTTNENEQYNENEDNFNGVLVAVVVIIILVLLIVIAVCASDDYGSHGGFGGGRSYYYTRSSCVRSSCACVRSSCACACACAGGGRAGCSKKDFYNTNLRIEVIQDALEK